MDEKTYEDWLETVKEDGLFLEYVPEDLRTAELCEAAVKKGRALKYVPEALKTPEICLAAVQENGEALEYYVPESLQEQVKKEAGIERV